MGKIHIVANRENLASIAKRYGLNSWEEIYYSPLNQKIRRMRPNPNQIQVGDRLFIPPNSLELAQQKLRLYEQLKKDWEESTKNILSNLEKDHQRFQRDKSAIDFVGFVLVSLVSLAKKAATTVGKKGYDLYKANEKFLKTFVDRQKELTKGIYGLVTSGDKIDTSKSKKQTWYEAGADFFMNMENPSYWAKQVAGDPEKSFAKMKQQVQNVHNKQIQLLDQRINQTKKAISFLKGRPPRLM